MKHLNNCRGAITLPALIAAFYMTATSFYLLFLLHEWHQKVEIQYRLDRCMAMKSQELVDRFQAVEDSNLRMQWARSIATLTSALPPVTAAARAWNMVEFGFQMARLLQHGAEVIKWGTQMGCDHEGSGIFVLPMLPYTPAGADQIGPRPFKLSKNTTLKFNLDYGKRSSTVAVYATSKNSDPSGFERVIPGKLRELLNLPGVSEVLNQVGLVPLPTKQWRSAWVPKF